MKKIIKYEVFSVISPADLDKFVNEKISQGWQPYGFMQMCPDGAGEILFTQVVVKFED